MGSVVSKVGLSLNTRRKVIEKTTAAKQHPSTKPTVSRATHASPKPDPHVTAEVRQHSPHQRKRSGEWAQLLNQMSGAITSSKWEGEVMPAHRKSIDEHPSSRSEKTLDKLPSQRTGAASGESVESEGEGGAGETQMSGRLSQNQILELYNLRRRNPNEWSAEKIAASFKVSEEDVRHLLMFTRTYKGTEEQDGHTVAYYKKDNGDVIVRFERD